MTRSLTLGFIAILAFSSGLLSACQPARTPETETTAQHEQHGGMHHEDHHMAMDLGPADEEFDLRFIDAMILHHEGAVDMAQDAQENSQRPEIRELADNIIRAQNQEIEQMQQWRQAWYPDAPNEAVAYNASENATQAMPSETQEAMRMSMDLGSGDEEFDLRFINAMIPHHEGALVMAEEVLEKSQRPELQQLARNIIADQQSEISQMQQWRQEWYGQ